MVKKIIAVILLIGAIVLGYMGLKYYGLYTEELTYVQKVNPKEYRDPADYKEAVQSAQNSADVTYRDVVMFEAAGVVLVLISIGLFVIKRRPRTTG